MFRRPRCLVNSVTPTSNGVDITFNRAIDATKLNLYDGAGGGFRSGGSDARGSEYRSVAWLARLGFDDEHRSLRQVEHSGQWKLAACQRVH